MLLLFYHCLLPIIYLSFSFDLILLSLSSPLSSKVSNLFFFFLFLSGSDYLFSTTIFFFLSRSDHLSNTSTDLYVSVNQVHNNAISLSLSLSLSVGLSAWVCLCISVLIYLCGCVCVCGYLVLLYKVWCGCKLELTNCILF